MVEREDIAMIPAQQLPQMRAAFAVARVALDITRRAGDLERLGNLVVQLPAILRSTACAKNTIENDFPEPWVKGS